MPVLRVRPAAYVSADTTGAHGLHDGRQRRPARGNATEDRAAATDGPEANARLTGAAAAVLLVLLAGRGLHGAVRPQVCCAHVFIGMLPIPPVRAQDREHALPLRALLRGGQRRTGARGPLPWCCGCSGPFVVTLTVSVLGTGVVLMFVPGSARDEWLFLHKASFVLWFGAMTIHVLGHLADTARLSPRDWYGRTRREVRGAGIRQWAVVTSVALGVLLGLLLRGADRALAVGAAVS